MKLPSTQCPYCRSYQRFPRREAEVNGRIVVFMRCTVCQREIVLSAKTIEETRQHAHEMRRRNQRLRRSA